MSHIHSTLSIADFSVKVTRKKMKNLRLRVCPPDGVIQLSAPFFTSNREIEQFVVENVEWIKQQKQQISERPRKPTFQYRSGELHLFRGQEYPLEVIERNGVPHVKFIQNAVLLMHVKPRTSQAKRQSLLERWYRQQLASDIEQLLEKWLPIIDKPLAGWGIRKMKARWGSCNIRDKRILLSLELAQKSTECLEYVLVHELVHLHESNHNKNFYRLMTQFLPDWKCCHDSLNSKSL